MRAGAAGPSAHPHPRRHRVPPDRGGPADPGGAGGRRLAPGGAHRSVPVAAHARGLRPAPARAAHRPFSPRLRPGRLRARGDPAARPPPRGRSGGGVPLAVAPRRPGPGRGRGAARPAPSFPPGPRRWMRRRTMRPSRRPARRRPWRRARASSPSPGWRPGCAIPTPSTPAMCSAAPPGPAGRAGRGRAPGARRCTRPSHASPRAWPDALPPIRPPSSSGCSHGRAGRGRRPEPPWRARRPWPPRPPAWMAELELPPPGGRPRLLVEQEGAMSFRAPGGEFTVTARADRIEVRPTAFAHVSTTRPARRRRPREVRARASRPSSP